MEQDGSTYQDPLLFPSASSPHDFLIFFYKKKKKKKKAMGAIVSMIQDRLAEDLDSLRI